MTNTPEDQQDPTAGILADLENLRAEHESRTDGSGQVDEDTRARLDSLADAAGSLREPAAPPVRRDSGNPDEAEAPRAARDESAPRSARSAVANRGLIFESAVSGADESDDHDDPAPVQAAAPAQVDLRNPFAFNQAFSAPEEPVTFEAAPIPTGGGLLFQPPHPELAEQVDSEWDEDDVDEFDDDSADDDTDNRDDSEDSDDSGDAGDSDDDRGRRDGRRSRSRGSGRRSRRRSGDSGNEDSGDGDSADDSRDDARDTDDSDDDSDDSDSQPRRRRRGGRGRRSRNRDQQDDSDASNGQDSEDDSEDTDDSGSGGSNRSRRRSGRGSGRGSQQDQDRRGGQDDSGRGDDSADDDSEDGSNGRRRRRTRSRRPAGGGSDDSQVTGLKGSTRLEAKRQRRREGREAGRRRPVITEAEFLARRESVERTMLVRETDGRTQLVVLEDGIAVEHYLSEAKAHASIIGNVYLGKVQNVLPSMEAAFVDIGKGRNAVLYAGEVNWDVLGMEGKPRRIEVALNPGDPVLVQVTKDPIGHKGARLTSQVSLPGRFLVYVPGNSMTGISRKLPDTERQRLKKVLKELVPGSSGVIVRTAAEGASESELGRDVERLSKRWESIEKKSKSTKVQAPQLLYSEPDMTVRIIRDVFNEDFSALVVDGDKVWETIREYVEAVAPDLLDRVSRYEADGDIFEHYRVAEQIEKALDRKVNLPSGGSLVIDRTEAMTVIDVNTGKFTGSGGNLEETVTKNNLEAAEEVIRQLRLRDIGGIIVVDFIDMVLESNRDLVVRRLIECLGRDRTKHQVAEVTSLGLVQMTRKRIGTGLAESLAQAGEDFTGRGLLLPGTEPEQSGRGQSQGRSSRRRKGQDSAKDSRQDQRRNDSEPIDEEKQDASRSAVAAIAKATLKKDEDAAEASAADAEEVPGDGTAAGTPAADESGEGSRTGGSGDPDPGSDGSEEKTAGRRSSRRGRGRGSRRGGAQSDDSRSEDTRSEDAPATAVQSEPARSDSGTEDSQPADSGATGTVPGTAPAEDAEPAEPKRAARKPRAKRTPTKPTGPAPLMIGADSATRVQQAPQVQEKPEPAPQASESKPVEKPADTKPAETKPAETKAALPVLMIGMDG
ncbi:Rne/Rng family ribonuclease [Brevibacterium sp. NPDC049920]|uniref:S1 motif domain-containing protein n=2 Tax=Brevibacterium TaxID=1696 RepID=A0ABP8JG39_9MICO